jgi:hypothetical protein
VRYVHWRRRSRKNSLSKMEYKNIVERKSLRTQNPNTPKSHYHTIEIILKRRIQKTEIRTLLLLGQDGGWSLYFLLTLLLLVSLLFTVAATKPKENCFSFASSRRQEERTCAALLARRTPFSLLSRCLRKPRRNKVRLLLFVNSPKDCNLLFIKAQSRSTIQTPKGE